MIAPMSDLDIDQACAEICCPEGCRVKANDPGSDGICERHLHYKAAAKAALDAATQLAALL